MGGIFKRSKIRNEDQLLNERLIQRDEVQLIDERADIKTMKACIVSMEYKIKNNDGKKEVAPLGESYTDAKKVRKLFENTLGWNKDDVITFKDKMLHMKNLYNKIDNHIKNLKTIA
jgi:hypothetical protein